jgi:hypothetical protein
MWVPISDETAHPLFMNMMEKFGVHLLTGKKIWEGSKRRIIHFYS